MDTGFFAHEALSADLLVQVFNFLGTRQHARLLGVLGVERDAVQANGMALGDENLLTRLQLVASGHGLVQAVGGVTACQPIGQQATHACIVELELVKQARQLVLGRRSHGDTRGVEAELGHGHIGGKGFDAVDAGHFKGRQTLAQSGFQGLLPTGCDVQFVPQGLQILQAVFVQPGRESLVGAQLFLQGFQGFLTGLQLHQLGRLLVAGLLRLTSVVFHFLGHVFQGLQLGLALGRAFFGFGQLRLQLLQMRVFRQGQGLLIGLQTGLALLELAGLLLHATLLGSQHLDLLLHLVHQGGLGMNLLLGIAPELLKFGQLFGFQGQVILQTSQLRLRRVLVVKKVLRFFLRLGALAAPLFNLRLNLNQAFFSALTAFHHETDFSFQPTHFSTGLVELSLGLIHLFTGFVMRLANGFHTGFDLAQIGGF